MSAEKSVIPKIARPRLSLSYNRTDLHNLLDMVAKTGENISIRRFARYQLGGE